MREQSSIDVARALLRSSITERRLFPAAVAEVGDGEGVRWRDAFGALSFDDAALPADDRTIFDLASLTKPLATASVVMQLEARGALTLDEPVSAFFQEWRGGHRGTVTVRDLLEHASGLPARLVDPPPAGRREFEHEISTMPLEYEPRTRSVYSDLGFLLLGFIASDRGGAGLDVLFEEVAAPSRMADDVGVDEGTLTFSLTAEARLRAAPTQPLPEDPRRGRRLVGEVHDNYAAALGGIAGHAGLFGTTTGVGRFARMMLRALRGDESGPPPFVPRTIERMTRKSTVPGSSRALGWDTMLPSSSCGVFMSGGAFGHVGFTGTSLWIDPPRDRYYVLLTNRVAGGGTVPDMLELRRRFHDTLAGA
jgi:CubicO group peptidase (beta-lactamase class C family)